MVSSQANQGILCYFPLARETILLSSHGTKGNYQGKVQFPLAGELANFPVVLPDTPVTTDTQCGREFESQWRHTYFLHMGPIEVIMLY
jgi:hypothetical protein